MKHKAEWARLIHLAKLHRLTQEQMYFLLALRELESGEDGTEFNVKAAEGTGLEEQALWAIGSIRKNNERWQDYIRDKGCMDFPFFFFYLGGPYGTGWHPESSGYVNQINNLIEGVKNEFERSLDLGEKH